MLGSAVDRLVSIFSPEAAARRVHARSVYERRRSYASAEQNRLTDHRKRREVNKSADSELLEGADRTRARARALVRDNSYAWGVRDSIVANTIGCGIVPQASIMADGGDEPLDVMNEQIERVWRDWCHYADITGLMHFNELQALVLGETAEAGECLVKLVSVTDDARPVPLALEVIEADRLASEQDTFFVRNRNKLNGNEVRRGVEIDSVGRPVAYWIYPKHPSDINTTRVEPMRHDARDIVHFYRQDRAGQTRGISWFAPVVCWLRDMGFYLDNELQASAVGSCFTVAITSDNHGDGGILPSSDEDTTDTDGNRFEYLQPGLVTRLAPGEKIEGINPGRPNSAAEPWINLMLRGIAVGTGLSYELVARDYSKTSFSSNRASALEDRRRFRRWQKLFVWRFLQPIWHRWLMLAAVKGIEGFPTPEQLLDDPARWSAVEWQAPGWEWVDPMKEQQASDAAVKANMSTLADELAAKGKDWRTVLKQRAREREFGESLGLTMDMEQAKLDAQTEAANAQEQKETADV